MTRTELLGTVYLAVEIETTPRGLDAAEYGLSAAPDVVNVAPGEGAVGIGLATISLTTSATNAELLLPDAFPAGLSISQTADSRGAVFYLDSAIAGGAEIDESIALTVSRTDNANYAPLERTARIRISALAQPPAREETGRIVDGATYSNAQIADLRTGDYANATFAPGRRGKQRGLAD